MTARVEGGGHMERIDLGPDIHDWLQAGELATQIGAKSSAHVAAAGTNEGLCNGYKIQRRAIGPEDEGRELHHATQYLYRVARDQEKSAPKADTPDESLKSLLRENAELREKLEASDKIIARYRADAAKVEPVVNLQAENDELKWELHATRELILRMTRIVADGDDSFEGLDIETAIRSRKQERLSLEAKVASWRTAVENALGLSPDESRGSEWAYREIKEATTPKCAACGGDVWQCASCSPDSATVSSADESPQPFPAEVKRLRIALWHIARFLGSDQRADAASIAIAALRESYEGVPS